MFSQFFFTTLNRKTRFPKDMSAAQRRHERVKHWTKNINLFDKNFIIIPIHEPNHWYVVVICFPSLTGPVVIEEDDVQNTKQWVNLPKESVKIFIFFLLKNTPLIICFHRPYILIFDSLGCGPRNRVAEMLREYLSHEYSKIYGDVNPRVFNQHNMPSFSVKVPQQISHVDCGVYMLEYVERFFKVSVNQHRLCF